MLKTFGSFLALLVTPLFVPNNVMAGNLVNTHTFYPSVCRMVVDEWKAECEWVTLGLVSDYSAFNVKLCSSNNRGDGLTCLILIGEASELENYPGLMRISSIAWQENNSIVKQWSGNIIFGPYKDGYGLFGTVQGSVIAVYFE